MNRRPTLLDVAGRARVSPKTVSRVINGEPNVSADTTKRVRDAIEALGFHPNENARSLRPGQRSRLIGLVIGDLSNPFYARMASGVEEVARTRSNLVLMGSSEEDVERERDVVLALCRRRVDGMLMVPTGSDHAYVHSQIEAGTPFVFVDRPIEGNHNDAVVIDNREGARMGVANLIQRGHKRIGMIGDMPQLYTTRERMAGYCDALQAAGVPADQSLIRVGAHDPALAEQVTADLLGVTHPPTALFAGNNRICTGVLRVVTRQNATVDVLGFDDLELIGTPTVGLSLLRYDPADLGREAARLLFDRLNGAAVAPPRQVRITPELREVSRGKLPRTARATA